MTQGEDFSKHLLVVIVLFRQSLEICNAFRSLTSAFQNPGERPTLFVFDNSPGALPPSVVGWSIYYVASPVNAGVSKAYNTAYEYARRRSFDWLLLLDQDTNLPGDFAAKYAEAIRMYTGHRFFVPLVYDRRGLLSPFAFHWGGGVRLKRIAPGPFPPGYYCSVNSGMLIASTLFEKSGGFDERLPLDFSDIVFVSKLRKIKEPFVVVDLPVTQDFSGSKMVPSVTALERFETYCSAVLAVHRSYQGEFRWIRSRAFMRALQLMLRYRDLQFVKIIIRML